MIKTAVIGVGNIGYHHARNYASFDTSRLVAVCDRDNKQGQKTAQQFGTTFYANYLEMLEKERPDAISIAVPTALHAEIAINAMAYVSHILVEKPIASTTQEAQEMIRAAKKHKVNLSVGYVERFNPVISELQELLEKKTIGEILSITVRRVGLYPAQIKNSNVLTDLATHDIDIFNYLLKDKAKILAAAGGKLRHSSFDHAELFLRYGKITCFLQVNWVTPAKIRSIAITGTKGYIEANYLLQELVVYQTDFTQDFNDFGEFLLRYSTPTKTDVSVPKAEPLNLELKAFIASIKTGQSIVPATEALQALITAEAAAKFLEKNTK